LNVLPNITFNSTELRKKLGNLLTLNFLKCFLSSKFNYQLKIIINSPILDNYIFRLLHVNIIMDSEIRYKMVAYKAISQILIVLISWQIAGCNFCFYRLTIDWEGVYVMQWPRIFQTWMYNIVWGRRIQSN